MATPAFALSVRSYGRDSVSHHHPFAQLVLPLGGSLVIDLAGHEGRIDRCRAAFVAPGLRHSQNSSVANRSLVLDFDPAALSPVAAERLADRPFVSLTPAVGKLIDYMEASATFLLQPPILESWSRLLLDALTAHAPQLLTRLHAVCAAVEADPGAPWTAAAMARRGGLSTSRLHALFRETLDTTPRAWLAELRLRRVREALATTDVSIAELAYRGGYADQSALTRAMRRVTGLTPAAYRRAARESRTKQR